MDSAVVALLVSHDGARWLPAVIDGLRGQTTQVSGVMKYRLLGPVEVVTAGTVLEIRSAREPEDAP